MPETRSDALCVVLWLTFHVLISVANPHDDSASCINTLLMQLRKNEFAGDVKMSLELLHRLGQDDGATHVVTPTLVEIEVPFLIEQEVLTLFWIPRLTKLKQWVVLKLGNIQKLLMLLLFHFKKHLRILLSQCKHFFFPSKLIPPSIWSALCHVFNMKVFQGGIPNVELRYEPREWLSPEWQVRTRLGLSDRTIINDPTNLSYPPPTLSWSCPNTSNPPGLTS